MSVITRTLTATRGFATSALRNGYSEGIPPPGYNLPFQIENRYRLTAMFCLFFGSGFAVPFLAIRHQILKK